MKKILSLCLGLFLLNGLFALDLSKVEQVWDKSMDVAITELDNLKDFDIPKAEEVQAKVDNEMYISELESKVVQLEAEVNLLKEDLRKERRKNLIDKAIDCRDSEIKNLKCFNEILKEENKRLKELLKTEY